MTVRPDAPSPKPSLRPWAWVPSLYFAEGVPYVIAMVVSVTLYKKMGVSNAEIALYTSWLYLPWVIKPLWSPVVDLLKTRRAWIVTMQLLIGAVHFSHVQQNGSSHEMRPCRQFNVQIVDTLCHGER